MNSIFNQFAPALQRGIAHRLGWTELREVQERAGEALLAGANAVILAPTAGGKTEAAMFPALSDLLDDPSDAVGILYLSPIKALLNNQAERFDTYTDMVGLRRFVWHGDVGRSDRENFVDDPSEVLMTTPESLEVMFVSSMVPERDIFADLRMVVVDEIHALAGTDRGAHLMSLIERIEAVAERDLQRVGLSATVGNPERMSTWLGGSSPRDNTVVNPAADDEQTRQLLVTQRDNLVELGKDAAVSAEGHKSLFFCQSRAVTEAVARQMRGRGTDVFVHHSSVSADEREAAEARFRSNADDACIVCTSTLELGIDVGDLDRVFQADAPSTVDAFLQRMGRTGRREGEPSNMTFFCQSPDAVLQAVALIERAKAGWVEPVEPSRRAWPVLAHQLLALTLARGGIPRDRAWGLLESVPNFVDIDEEEFGELVDHMAETGYLYEQGGYLALGGVAETKYGGKNFLELYSVFSTPKLFDVVTPTGKEIGTLEQRFVDTLAEAESSFVLGGRSWQVDRINQSAQRIKVYPAPKGQEPSWGGIQPQFLSREVCQTMRDVLQSDTSYGYLHDSATEALQDRRDEFRDLLLIDDTPVTSEPDRVTWWTFAGGQINTTFKYALETLGDWEVTTSNLRVEIEGEGIEEAFDRLRSTMRDDAFWEREALWSTVRRSLPDYRLSKFQALLPDWAEREMLAEFLLDMEGARAFVGQ
jgi:ATP-dependent Lhr-like helicase